MSRLDEACEALAEALKLDPANQVSKREPGSGRAHSYGIRSRSESLPRATAVAPKTREVTQSTDV